MSHHLAQSRNPFHLPSIFAFPCETVRLAAARPKLAHSTTFFQGASEPPDRTSAPAKLAHSTTFFQGASELPAEPTARERCVDFLETILAKGKGVHVKVVMDAAKAKGLSFGTLMRVKKDMGVVIEHLGRLSYWHLPPRK